LAEKGHLSTARRETTRRQKKATHGTHEPGIRHGAGPPSTPPASAEIGALRATDKPRVGPLRRHRT